MLVELLMFAALAQADPVAPRTAPDADPSQSLIGGALRFADTTAETDAFEAGWKNEKVCELLVDNEMMRAARCTFPPGFGHERHRHNAHWGYVVEGGTMRITDKSGTAERKVKPGDTWWSDGIGWHEVVNVGKTTGVYIIVEPKGAPE